MSVYHGMEKSVAVNPEFTKPVPTNGFGEVEATVVASLGHPGAPRPRPIATAKLPRKVCRIHSPVSPGRAGNPGVGGIRSLNGQRRAQHQGGLLRPHTADAAIMYRPRKMVAAEAGAAAHVDGTPASSTAARTKYSDAADSARQMMAGHCNRPMTSDASSYRRQKQRHDDAGSLGRASGSSTHSDAAAVLEGQFRPSTSGSRRRRGQAVSHGRSVARGEIIRTGLAASPHNNNEKGDSSRRWQQQRQQQQEHKMLSHESSTNPDCDVDGRRPTPKGLGSRREDVHTPPNRYWPTSGGAKEFLRPFIEKHQSHLWAYDPALVGMNHVEAYRHIVSKGNFEAVKRKLLEKEDALTKGTGSFQMADTIGRFRGGSARRPSTSAPLITADGPETRQDYAGDRPSLNNDPSWGGSGIMTAVESDPFQCGGCNGDKIRRDGTRRRDLLAHARARDNIFCRRKGYEPGDFLKHRTSQLVVSRGGVANSTNTTTGSGSGSGSRKSSARSAAAAAELRRRAHHQRGGGVTGTA